MVVDESFEVRSSGRIHLSEVDVRVEDADVRRWVVRLAVVLDVPNAGRGVLRDTARQSILGEGFGRGVSTNKGSEVFRTEVLVAEELDERRRIGARTECSRHQARSRLDLGVVLTSDPCLDYGSTRTGDNRVVGSEDDEIGHRHLFVVSILGVVVEVDYEVFVRS